MRCGLGSCGTVLPKKLSSSMAVKAGVGVAAADQAELVGIGAERLLQLEAVL